MAEGAKYLTLVYQIDEGCKRLLWVGRDRTEESLRGFFKVMPGEVKFIVGKWVIDVRRFG